MSVTRKNFLLGASASAIGLGARPVRAAPRFTLRLGIDLPADHPVSVNAAAAASRIEAATGGAVAIRVFPANQLGDDTSMLSQTRAGAIQMMAVGVNTIATLAPGAAISGLGFAFKDSRSAWKALDGGLGDLVRTDIRRAGLEPMPLIWDEGLREITSGTHQIDTPADLHGFKIRVPPGPIAFSLFASLGASPVTLNAAELYTSLQTGVADGQENPLGVIETQKLYEVQKYCSLTNHMWLGYWVVMNAAFWKRLPPDVRKLVADGFDSSARTERGQNQALNDSLEAKLKQQKMSFARPDQARFRDALTKAGYYRKWQAKFGPALWSALAKEAGPLG